jgi:hypothetical protein
MSPRVEIIGDCILSVMVLRVGRPRHYLKVFNGVVGFVAVAMVDNLVTIQRALQIAFHHHAVFTSPRISVAFGRDSHIPVCVVRLPSTIEPMGRPARTDNLALPTAAALRDAFTQRPSLYSFCRSALAAAQPVVKLPALLRISGDDKTAKCKASEIGNLIHAPVARLGC